MAGCCALGLKTGMSRDRVAAAATAATDKQEEHGTISSSGKEISIIVSVRR